MPMLGIVIVAHGGLAEEYLAAVEHVLGHQEGIKAVAIEPEGDREAKKAEICRIANEVDEGVGVVMVTDMFGGSPSNLSMPACAPNNRLILYGVNLPALIKLAQSRYKPVKVAVELARDAGRRYINLYDVAPESE